MGSSASLSKNHNIIVDAATGGHLNIIKLIERKQEECLSDDIIETCTGMAVMRNHVDVVKYMRNKIKWIDSDTRKYLKIAAKYGNLEIVKYFAEDLPSWSPDIVQTCIKIASRGLNDEKYLAVIKYIVDNSEWNEEIIIEGMIAMIHVNNIKGNSEWTEEFILECMLATIHMNNIEIMKYIGTKIKSESGIWCEDVETWSEDLVGHCMEKALKMRRFKMAEYILTKIKQE